MDHILSDLRAAGALADTTNDNTRPVVTSHVFPPIPCRDFDWCAHFDDVGADCSPHGWGRTEAEAKQDLLDNYGDDE
jgi:hypothetical protein